MIDFLLFVIRKNKFFFSLSCFTIHLKWTWPTVFSLSLYFFLRTLTQYEEFSLLYPWTWKEICLITFLPCGFLFSVWYFSSSPSPSVRVSRKVQRREREAGVMKVVRNHISFDYPTIPFFFFQLLNRQWEN